LVFQIIVIDKFFKVDESLQVWVDYKFPQPFDGQLFTVPRSIKQVIVEIS
jgi:hypothetical protein